MQGKTPKVSTITEFNDIKFLWYFELKSCIWIEVKVWLEKILERWRHSINFIMEFLWIYFPYFRPHGHVKRNKLWVLSRYFSQNHFSSKNCGKQR